MAPGHWLFFIRSIHVSSIYTITADRNLRFDELTELMIVKQTTKQSLITLSQNEHIFKLTNLWNSLNMNFFHIQKTCLKKLLLQRLFWPDVQIRAESEF